MVQLKEEKQIALYNTILLRRFIMNIVELRELITPLIEMLRSRELKAGMLSLFGLSSLSFALEETLNRAVTENRKSDETLEEIQELFETSRQSNVDMIYEDRQSLLRVDKILEELWESTPIATLAERRFRIFINQQVRPHVRRRLWLIGQLQNLTIEDLTSQKVSGLNGLGK